MVNDMRHSGQPGTSLKAVAALLAALILATDASAQAGKVPPARQVTSSALESVWVAPRPFRCPEEEVRHCQGNLVFREDWLPILTDASKWPVVLRSTRVFKTYILVLQEKSGSGKAETSLSNSDLDRLVRFTRDHSLQVAFEVGGLRTSAEMCGSQAGESFALREVALLKRWLAAGGEIHYITSDHAVMKNMRGVGFRSSGLDEKRECKMTVRELIGELADYFQVVHREIPQAKLGVIESLGFFRVRGAGKEVYKQSDPKLPEWYFNEFFDDLVKAMRERKLELDHFHIDFGYNGVRFDGRQGDGKPNFGRVLAVESYVQSKGVRSGVIFNSTLDDEVKQAGRDAANREMRARTLGYFKGYIEAGGRGNDVLIQSWDPYPDLTGPEDKPLTFFGNARDLVNLGHPTGKPAKSNRVNSSK